MSQIPVWKISKRVDEFLRHRSVTAVITVIKTFGLKITVLHKYIIFKEKYH